MEDLNQLAKNANITTKDQQGFISCSVYGDPPQGLIFRFDSNQNAEAYELNQFTLGRTQKRRVEGSNLVMLYPSQTEEEQSPKVVKKPWWKFWG